MQTRALRFHASHLPPSDLRSLLPDVNETSGVGGGEGRVHLVVVLWAAEEEDVLHYQLLVDGLVSCCLGWAKVVCWRGKGDTAGDAWE